MKNELLKIGPLTVYGYGAMIALGVIAAWVVTELRAKKHRLSSDHVFALVLWGLLGGLLCAKLLYWITEWKSIIADPGFILDTLPDGFVVYGGILGGILAGWIYKKLKIRPTTLLLICVTSMGVMNLLPWGGPTMRAATVLGIEPNELWLQILPMQIVGIIIALATAVFWGFVEKKRGAGAVDGASVAAEGDLQEEVREYARPKLFWFNLILTGNVLYSVYRSSPADAGQKI